MRLPIKRNPFSELQLSEHLLFCSIAMAEIITPCCSTEHLEIQQVSDLKTEIKQKEFYKFITRIIEELKISFQDKDIIQKFTVVYTYLKTDNSKYYQNFLNNLYAKYLCIDKIYKLRKDINCLDYFYNVLEADNTSYRDRTMEAEDGNMAAKLTLAVKSKIEKLLKKKGIRNKHDPIAASDSLMDNELLKLYKCLHVLVIENLISDMYNIYDAYKNFDYHDRSVTCCVCL